MSIVRFIADTHFGHEKIALKRGMSIEEHDDLLISNWNKTVTKRDTTYVLGDIVMEKHQLLWKYIPQLNGNIVVIGGNHDTPNVCRVLQQMGILVLGCFKYKGFILTHIPITREELFSYKDNSQRFRGNIHGHIHDKVIDDPLYINVGVEQIGFAPITLDQILEMRK